MQPERFDKITEEQIQDIRRTLLLKSKEYARRGDRLSNFKTAARFDTKIEETPERALWGMWRKHLVSILDIIDDLDNDILPSVPLLNEKCRDVVNYAILLKALILERYDMFVNDKIINKQETDANMSKAINDTMTVGTGILKHIPVRNFMQVCDDDEIKGFKPHPCIDSHDYVPESLMASLNNKK